MRKTQSITFSDSMSRQYKRHSFRWGLDYRREMLDSRTNSNPRGSYVFTGLFTGLGTSRVTGTDLADFLLGLPQQASLQYGPGVVQLRSNSVSLYFQDDWRVSTNFTLNAGVRYEYQSPYSESNNHLVNLDAPRRLLGGGAGPGRPGRPLHGRVPADDHRRRTATTCRRDSASRGGRSRRRSSAAATASTTARCRTCRWRRS